MGLGALVVAMYGVSGVLGFPHSKPVEALPAGFLGALWGEMFLCSNARAGSYNRTFKSQNSRDFRDGCGRFILIFLPGWSLPRFGGAFLSGQAEPNPGVPNCPAAEDGNPSARGMTLKAPALPERRGFLDSKGSLGGHMPRAGPYLGGWGLPASAATGNPSVLPYLPPLSMPRLDAFRAHAFFGQPAKCEVAHTSLPVPPVTSVQYNQE